MPGAAPTSPSRQPLLQRLAGVRPEEAPAVLWSMLYVVALFLAYYVLRPIRDELGVAGGVQNLPWLFTGTLLAMLVASPLFALAVRSLPRRQFIALAYRFFAANLVLFALLLHFADPQWQVWVGRAFFIWVSVFNLFVVSVFWSFMVDLFDSEQGKRLFGLFAAGATAGGLLETGHHVRPDRAPGPLLADGDRHRVPGTGSARLAPAVAHRAGVPARRAPRQPGSAAGRRHLRGHGPHAALALPGRAGDLHPAVLGHLDLPVLPAGQHRAGLVPDRAARTAFFANIDLIVNAVTLVFQLFVTGRMMATVGIVATLCVLPLVSLLGFAALAASPSVAVIVAAQVARRVANFALARPAREILFTSSAREDRYKAKNFIDTVVYRGGDQIASWGYAGLMGLGLTLAQIPMIAVPLSAVWLGLSVWLGRTHQAQERQDAATAPSIH